MTERVRKTYTREFKHEAVRLAEESSLPMSQVARQLGLHRNVLANWRKQVANNDGETNPSHPENSTSEDELERLRQEVKLLKQEREVLKKALAIIGREQT